MEIDLEVFPEQQLWFTTSDRVNHEFEVRCRTTNYGISHEAFQKIVSSFPSPYVSQYEEYEHVSYSDPYSTEKQAKEYRVKKGREIMSKQSLRKNDIEYIGFSFRISEAIETPEKSLPEKLKSTFSRWIQRSSFTNGPLRIDCSQVTNTKLFDFSSKQMIPKEWRKSFVTYEVEIEYKASESHVVFFDELYPILRKMAGILHQGTPLPPVPRIICLQKKSIETILIYFKSKVGVPLDYTLHGKAINIKSYDFKKLDQYALTNKLDGERKIIYSITRNGKRWAYIMNAVGPMLEEARLDTFFAVDCGLSSSVVPDTLIDCEYDHGVYHMFDVLYCEKQLKPSDAMNHRDRMAIIQPEWFAFPFQKKQFYYRTVEQNIQDLIDANKDAVQFFEQNDGFIFTYPACSYLDTREKYTHLKYKFSAKLSLDFYIDEIRSTDPNIPFAYHLYSNQEHMERSKLGKDKPFGQEIQNGPRRDFYPWILHSITPLTSHSIVECLWYHNFGYPKWIMLRYRHDRIKGNHRKVVEDVFQDMERPIPVQGLFPFPSVHSYVSILETKNASFVVDHFQESLLSFLYMTMPVDTLLHNIYSTLGITADKNIKTSWLQLALKRLPSDYNVLQAITSVLPRNEPVWRYTKHELDYIYGLYTHVFPHDTNPTIFDVRSFSLLTESHQLCRSHHGWVSERTPPRVLPPLVAKPHELFPFDVRLTKDYPKYKRFSTVEASRYSSLKPWEEPQVAKAFQKWFRYPERVKRVIDATAHIGVDTVHLAELFSEAQMDVYEIVSVHAVALQRNLKEFGLEKRVTFHYQDVTTWIPTEPIDLVYVDPPWGGPSYKDKTCLELYMQGENELVLADKNINYILDQWMSTGLVKHVVLKVPSNFNKVYLMNRYKVEEIAIYDRSGKRFSYGLLHIENTIPFLYKPKTNLTVWSVPYVATLYEPIFANTNAVLVRVPRPNDPMEWVQTRLCYNMYQPFSYERPVLIEYTALIEYATKNGFQTNGQYIPIEHYYYLFFTKVIKSEPEETGALQDMRKYHNVEKKYIIKQYARKKSVLDLGAGYGGDFFKYEEVGVTRLIAVEPNRSNMVTLKNRLDTTSSIQYVTTLINTVGQDWDTIRPYLRERVDVVASFFSMTFLFESIDILRGFLHTVDQSMVEGGYFIGTMMSGEKTYQLLEHVPKEDSFHLGKDIAMTKRYDNSEPKTGMALRIQLNETIVGVQDEYLAFFSILKQEMEKLGFVLVTTYDFQPPPKLAPYEILFSQLNIGFVFRKLPVSVSYSTPFLAENDTYEFMNLYGESQVLIRTGVQHPYSFYHAYLYNTSYTYRQSTSRERAKLAKAYHDTFHDKKEGQELAEIPMTLDMIGDFMDSVEVNIYLIDTITRRPIKTLGIDVSRDNSIVIVHHPTEYEPMAVLYEKEAIRIFPKMNPFLIHIHRTRQ